MLRSISSKLHANVRSLSLLGQRPSARSASTLLLQREQRLRNGVQGAGGPATAAIFKTSLSERFYASDAQEGIDRSLLRLDQEIRKTGRVARQEIDEIMQDVREMKKATSNQTLMIIRCCGELVPSETSENRTKLVQEVWKTMEALSVPIDISHYNALLRVYLENEHKFNPTEILQELSNKGLEPNRVTYQRLIARYCQEGDIDGASTILQYMKEKQLPINEYVFNSLINGHAKADDMESAEGMIAVMKQAGLEPNDDTYVTLMCGYARKGDLASISRIVKDCNDKEVHLIDKDFMEVIFTLAANGHENLVEEVFPMLKKHAGFNQDATNLILRLVNIEKLEIAYRMLKEMPKLVRNEEFLPSGNFFIHQLVNQCPTDVVVSFCNRMNEDGTNKYALSKACDIALQSRKFDKAVELLEAFKGQGAPIRQHYFWPFFATSKTDQDVYKGIKCMRHLEIPPTAETLREYIIPALFKHGKDTPAQKILEKLGSYTGIPLSQLVPAAMHHLLGERQYQQAINFANKYRLNFNNITLRRSLVDAYFSDNNAKVIVQIVGSAKLDSEEKAREAAGQFLMEVLERAKNKTKAIVPILEAMLNFGIGLSNSGAEIIQNHIGDELTPEIASLIEKLTSNDLTARLSLFESEMQQSQPFSYQDKSPEELEGMLQDAISNGKPTRGIRKALLFAYCKKKDLDKAESIRQTLAQEGFVFPVGLQALLLDLYSQSDKLEEARAIYGTLRTALMETPIDDIKILRYAGLLASNELLDECIDVLRNCPRDENRRPTGGMQQAAAWKILNSFAEKGQVESTLKVFECLKERNLIQVSNVTLGPVVKAYVTNDDLEGALAFFENCVKEHHATPWKQDLFCRFIKAEDADRLQKVIDLSTTLHGEVNTMYDLVFAFIQCGKLRQAKKILETPGLRARNDKIELTCQKYLEEDRIAELENLIKITKDIMQLDRNTMYFYLLQAYSKTNDTEKALSIWTAMQEENMQPSSDLLLYLADFLRRNNVTVPFVVPEEEVRRESGAQPEGRSQPQLLLKKYRASLEANEIDVALQLKQRIEGNGSAEKLSIKDVTNLIEKMARAERLGEATRLAEEMLEGGLHPHPKVLRLLLGRLSNAGEVNALYRLENKLTPILKRQVMFNTRLCVAYTNAGKGREYFEKYVKSEVENMKPSTGNDDVAPPLAGTTYLLMRHEELLPDFEELAKKAEQHGSLSLHCSLWNYHLIKKNFEKARELWNSKMKSGSRVLFRSIMVEARVKLDEEIARELVSQVMSSDAVSGSTKGAASGCLMDVLANTGKEDEAVKHLQATLKSLTLENIPRSSLVGLKDRLEAAGKTVPFKVPETPLPRQRRGKAKDAEGSESDSD